MRKRLIALLMVMVMLFSLPVYADDSITADATNIMDLIEGDELVSHSTSATVYVITEPEKLSKISDMMGYDDKGKLTEFTIFIPNTTISNNSYVVNNTILNGSTTPNATTTYHMRNIVNHGTGFKFENEYESYWYDGPTDLGSVTYTVECTNRFSVGGGIDADFISAELGFDVERREIKSAQYNISAEAGETVEVRVYPNYRKYTFDIYQRFTSTPGLLHPDTSGTAYQSCGLIFTQSRFVT